MSAPAIFFALLSAFTFGMAVCLSTTSLFYDDKWRTYYRDKFLRQERRRRNQQRLATQEANILALTDSLNLCNITGARVRRDANNDVRISLINRSH